MNAANPPEVPIDVDPETGVWTTDGLPMLYLPRHFFINNHLAIEQALGRAAYAKLLYTAGHRSAYYWCEQAAARHRLAGIGVFHHYLSRLSQRGWGRFDGGGIDPQTGTGEVRVTHSCFVAHAGRSAARKVCYMFAGWFPGALAWVGADSGPDLEFRAEEVQCAAEGHDACVFGVARAEH